MSHTRRAKQRVPRTFNAFSTAGYCLVRFGMGTGIVATFAGAAARPLLATTPNSEAHDFFENKIRPVLAAECVECHGAKKQKGGLRVDHRDGLRKGGDSGPAVVPGDAAKSLLLRAIKHLDPDLKMPGKAPQLGSAVIADFEKWITSGAMDPREERPAASAQTDTGKPGWEHLLAARRSWWSLQPIRNIGTPAVENAVWSEHLIDRFLLAKMEEQGLVPAADADASALLRRLTFAITGLPPTPEEIETFTNAAVKDRRSAIGNAVDRLLASPRFGEHWARHWMDLVRYADTHGSEGDPVIPGAWRYRDYLIRALNSDVPIDALIREHLAGDLLPEPRWNRAEQFNESILGTAQLRMVEHGFQPVDTLDEQVKVVDNQIDVATKAFQGLTVACARCHDHKFDAISQRDYYALFGVFASSRPAIVTIDAPERLATNRDALAELKAKIKEALARAWRAEAAQIDERLTEQEARSARAARLRKTIAAAERRLAQLHSEVRQRLLAAREITVAEILPDPIARWSFEGDARDGLGSLHGHLEGGAIVRGGRLVLDGRGAFVRTDPLAQEVSVKTLEAWVTVAGLTQSGGGVIALEKNRGQTFDALVFGEKEPARWMAGSEFYRRWRPGAAPPENATREKRVHLAIVYEPNGRITIYRDGAGYGTPYLPTGDGAALQDYSAGASQVLFGLRHTGAGNGFFAGEIHEARLYDRALTADQIASSFQAGPEMVGVSAAELASRFSADERHRSAALTAELERERAALHALAIDDGWNAALAEAETDSAHPLHPWVKLRGLPEAQIASGWDRIAARTRAQAAGAAEMNRRVFRDRWNPAQERYGGCFHHGAGLASGPARRGDFALTLEGPRVLTGLYPAGAMTHALSRKHNGLLATPRFRVDSDFISVRAWGGGGAQVRLIVDGYPLGTSGIFSRATLEKDEPTWIKLDVKYRRGSMAYLEFATELDLTRQDRQPAEERSWFGVERIVAHDDNSSPAELSGLALFTGPSPANARELAGRYEAAITDAITAWTDRSLSEEQHTLLDFFVRRNLLPVSLERLPTLAPLVSEYRRLEAAIPVPRRAPGVLEGDSYDAPFLVRGDHTKPAEPIPRAYLTVFSRQPFFRAAPQPSSERVDVGLPSGRLQLAEAITAPTNPLTARVMANRIWHWIYGRGLVPTPDNFGRLGDPPSHPELLDALATRLMAEGWSLKKMVRLLVTARAFGLSSEPTGRARDRDPGNVWLSHFRVRRLEAESIRDALLAVSGRLDLAMFGPGVDARAPADRQTRRSVYLMIRRTNLSPFLEAFDAPKPFSTLGRREATNVPAQSLTFLNDPFVVELARSWARREIAQGASSREERIRGMFSRALGRPPTTTEEAASLGYLEAVAAGAQLPPNQGVGEEGIWHDFARSILALKEFIYLR